jgi:hypothetical protein
MWTSLLEPAKLILINGARPALRRFHQELAHHVLHTSDKHVLWCDGDHGFNPYDFADLNLERGYSAEWGAERILVKRCMTPFQWDTVLTRHIDQKLLEVDAGLVLAAPYDQLFSTDELKDWEQEDYVRFSLKHLKELARQHKVPVVASVDMRRWWLSHPILAQIANESVDARWTVTPRGEGWVARPEGVARPIERRIGRQAMLPVQPELTPQLTVAPRANV